MKRCKFCGAVMKVVSVGKNDREDLCPNCRAYCLTIHGYEKWISPEERKKMEEAVNYEWRKTEDGGK